MATENSMQQIIDDSQAEIRRYEDILAQLHVIYAEHPMANEKAKRWIEEIGGHIETMKANIAAARHFQAEGAS